MNKTIVSIAILLIVASMTASGKARRPNADTGTLVYRCAVAYGKKEL